MIEVALLIVCLLGGRRARGDSDFPVFFPKHTSTVWGGEEVVRVLFGRLPTSSEILRMVNLRVITRTLSHLLEVDRHFFRVVRGADLVDDVNLFFRI
jgi:hypothetical protein